jgi:2,4-dienoyl-CoA reductase-like NADH-dependent reductase (Old Yellow Enzyme family)
LHLRNRIAIPPLCQYSAEKEEATKSHITNLGDVALSAADLMILEAST